MAFSYSGYARRTHLVNILYKIGTLTCYSTSLSPYEHTSMVESPNLEFQPTTIVERFQPISLEYLAFRKKMILYKERCN